MLKKLFKFSIICIILTAAVRFGRPLQAYAASAAVGFLLQEAEITVGDTVNVYFTVEADETIGDVEAYVSYDSDYLEFRLASSNVAGGDGVLKISDVFATSADTSKRYLIKFTALQPGTTEISVMNQPKIYQSENSQQMSVSSTVATVVIAPAVEASDNNRLGSLKISPGTLTPAFDPGIYVYQASVTEEIQSLYVSALPEDEKARVTISGNTPLYIGENVVHVFVTAETGRIQEYIINVNKEKEVPVPTEAPVQDEEPELTPTPPEEVGFVWKLEAVEEDGNILLQGNYRFTVCELTPEIAIPAGYQKTKLMISGISLVAYTPASNAGSDFALLVLQREGGEPALYRYDRAEKTIQRFVKEDIVVTREEPTPQENSSEALLEKYENNVNTMTFIIAVLIALWLLTAVGLIYFALKSKGVRDDFD